MHLCIPLLSLFLPSCTLASTLSAVGTDDGMIHPSAALQLRDIRTDIKAPLEGRALVSFTSGNGAVEAAVIALSGAAALAFCATTGGIGCVVAAAAAVDLDFVAGYVLSGRGVPTQSNVFLLLPPTPQKTHVERLTTELEPAVWHTIGHTHVNGFNHTLHFFNGGSFSQLRARQVPFLTSATSQKRADLVDNDGAVVDYTWENESFQPFNDFPRDQSDVNQLATDIINYMVSQQATAACRDFVDQDGVVASGILSIGVNNQPFDFNTVGGVQNAFSSCQSDSL